MISPKSVRRRYKKRGLFTIMYHLLGIAKHHLSSTISKSPRHETQALPCNFLTESFILAILGDKSTQANAFYIMSFINSLHKVNTFRFIKIEIRKKKHCKSIQMSKFV